MISGKKGTLYKPALHVVVGAYLFKVIMIAFTPVFSVWGRIDSKKKISQLLRDIERDMKWTISHLHPSIGSAEEQQIMMGRYLTVDLRCEKYIVWITREFDGQAYGFWADISSQSHPEVRTRIDVLAKKVLSSRDEQSKDGWPGVPQTLADLDSVIRLLHPYLEQYFV
jgi:hypothetical protein